MARLLLIIWFVITMPFLALAQRGNNWCFGLHCGLDFNSSPAKPFVSSIYGYNPSDRSYEPQSISDCKGNLLFYTGGGSYIWNREHKPLPSSKNICSHNGNNIFVPAPGDDSLYYLFQALNDSFQLSYVLIDLRQDSGRGDIIKRVEFSDSNGRFGGFIKHANDTDYWILFSTSSFTIRAFLLTKNGVSKIPVSSPFKGGSSEGNYPYMRSSNNGKYIISMANLYDFKYKYFIYNFDNSSGKLSNPRPLILNTDKKAWFFAFSPNDSILYGIRVFDPDSISIHQIDAYAIQPFKTINEITRLPRRFGNVNCQLGPDNRLYIDVSSDSLANQFGSVHKSISYIPYPDIWGKGCGFKMDGVYFNFDSVDVTGGKFPCHSYPIKRIANKFAVTGTNGCGYDTVRFTADADSAFKSYHWHFGDGDSAVGKSVVHKYKNAGSYYVKLGCELGNCGYKQWVGDSVTIKFKPNVSIEDSTYYTCGKYHVQTKISYRYCDTLNLHLGNLDTLLYTTNTDTAQTVIYNTLLDSNGIYIYYAAAKNANCYDSVATKHIVLFEPNITASFTPDYITSCGYSTITLTDSSAGKDSILQQRKWTVEVPNNIVKQYDTASSNKFKLIVQDTGYYNAKLVYVTKQGCMDSLYQTKVFRILPQPDVYIDSTMKNPLCFGDSFILTAKQKNTGYPPLTSYKWNMGQVTTLSIKVDSSNTYYVAAYNNYGCGSTSNKVKIDFLPQLFASVKKAKDSLYVITNRPVVSWEWYKDSVFYNTTSSLFHPPTGRYSVTVTDANGCQAGSGSLLYTTSIDKSVPIAIGIEAYPNPAHDVLYIKILDRGSTTLTTSNYDKKTEIVLYDMMGRKVQPLSISSEGSGLFAIAVSGLPKGLYILSVGSEKMKLLLE